jgi:hypothetical protein
LVPLGPFLLPSSKKGEEEEEEEEEKGPLSYFMKMAKAQPRSCCSLLRLLR